MFAGAGGFSRFDIHYRATCFHPSYESSGLVCDRLSQDVNESWVLHVGSLVKRAVDLAGTSALASLCHMRLVTLAVRLGAACPPQVLTDAVAASLPLASI